jgi:hypothetical protein
MGDYDNKKGLEFESFRPEEKEQIKKDPLEVINFSAGLVALLAKKVKAHNSPEVESPVSLDELRTVYVNGADCYSAEEAEKTCSEWALARVNMFLRQKSGEKMTPNYTLVKASDELDISEIWSPSEEDYIKASEEMKENNLNYEFQDVNELYIEPYKQLDIEW